MAGISQVVHIELTVPVCHHRLMVIGPGLSPSHRLNGMHADHWFQSSVMPLRTGYRLSGIVHHVTVVFNQSLYQLLVDKEHRAVLMPYRETDSPRLVLKSLEVLGTVGTVYLIPVTVIVDIPPVTHLCR